MMEKTAHQSEFDRKQITMAHRLGTSVSKTARLVKFSQSAILSICVKGINEGKTSNRCQSIEVYASSNNKDVGDCSALESKIEARQWVNRQPNAMQVEVQVFRYAYLSRQGPHSKDHPRGLLLVKCYCQLHLQRAQEHRD
ncbi:hypothetical protein TNCV_2012091 [Trichonephila clavipes]|nr:hypothetical protein TNCV_2012091 [Trichonephila clavipes]